MLILGGGCAALVEAAEFIAWSNDRRRARLRPDSDAGLADDELSAIKLEETETSSVRDGYRQELQVGPTGSRRTTLGVPYRRPSDSDGCLLIAHLCVPFEARGTGLRHIATGPRGGAMADGSMSQRRPQRRDGPLAGSAASACLLPSKPP